MASDSSKVTMPTGELKVGGLNGIERGECSDAQVLGREGNALSSSSVLHSPTAVSMNCSSTEKTVWVLTPSPSCALSSGSIWSLSI